jgi:hypothetical protein
VTEVSRAKRVASTIVMLLVAAGGVTGVLYVYERPARVTRLMRASIVLAPYWTATSCRP